MEQFVITAKSKAMFLATILYTVLGLGYTVGGYFGIHAFAFFKVLPLIILLILLFPLRATPHILKVIIGIIFGGAGDLVLEHGGSDFFALGAGFFLIGHVCYIFSFIDLWQRKSGSFLIKRKVLVLIITALILIISTINLSTTVSDKLKDDNFMMVLVLPVYLVFLSFSSINAFLLLVSERKPTINYSLMFAGTVFFLISDNILGRSMFANLQLFGEKNYNGIVIMVTYYLAQYLIATSAKEIKVENHQESLIQSMHE